MLLHIKQVANNFFEINGIASHSLNIWCAYSTANNAVVPMHDGAIINKLIHKKTNAMNEL